MLCTVPEGLPRKAKRPRQWQEIRLLAAQKPGRTQTRYASTFGSVQEAGQRWGHTARQAGRALKSRLHVVCDGAEWIRLQARETFGSDAHILTDLFPHQRRPRRRRARLPPARPPSHGGTPQQERLKTGASQRVILKLGAHREPEATPGDQAPVRTAHRYLSNRPDTLDYAAALAAERPIGSASSKAATNMCCKSD